jgi:hypothetical protein
MAAAIACAAAAACGGSVASGDAKDAAVDVVPVEAGDTGGHGDATLDAGGGGDARETGPPAEPDGWPPPPPCPAPSFAPPDGTSFVGSGTVTMTDVELPAGGSINYTIDGTNPNAKSPVYSSPIQVAQNETFRAMAMAPGCSMSSVVVASYTVSPLVPCEPPPPAFQPSSETQPNDFAVWLSYPAGVVATMCFTLDGTSPTSNGSGACTGTSQTYDADAGISINGSVTNITTGQVSVTVLGRVQCCSGDDGGPPCEFGEGPPFSQTYTLQAATPTLTGLDGGASPDGSAGFTPTLQSVTVASGSPADVPTIRYATDGGQPSCTTGLVTANPTTFGTGGAPSLPSSGVQLQALTCKDGYLPSSVASWSW